MTTASGEMEFTVSLANEVLNLASADAKLSEAAKYLVLAALDSDQMLADQLAGTAVPAVVLASTAPEPPPIGAFIAGIAVRGFRGIGPELKVVLQPGPGLTVISGRNGSGKSSLAEALEIALTGTSERSRKQTGPLYADTWRNLHENVLPSAELSLAEENSGQTTIGVEWPAGAAVNGPGTWVQREKAKREPGRAALGWSSSLELFRPVLSYDELGGLLEGRPSDLFDKLHSLLGLEQIAQADQRLFDAQKNLRLPADEAKKQLVACKASLAASSHELAVGALALVTPRAVNLAAVEQLISGAGADETTATARLRRLASHQIPDSSEVLAAVADLRAALTELDRVGSGLDDQGDKVVDLLVLALEHYEEQGDSACPVCAEGELNEDWATRASAAVGSRRESRQALAGARARVDRANHALLPFIGQARLPAGVVDLGLGAAAETIELADQFARTPADPIALAQHVANLWQPLADSHARLIAEAAAGAETAEHTWAPLAAELGSWVVAERRSRAAATPLKQVSEALKWLRDSTDQLRNQRLAPISDRAKAIWAKLRQESNVELGAITLEGQKTSRGVRLEAQVDGAPAGALGVMSQGELHALSLALFIPRATMPESPFRFIVLDDPIQAMDPAKVEGFVEVLGELAKDRQVIVLSHDDRLAAAVRRSGITARLLEVSRGDRSVVKVSVGTDPAGRHIDDAFAIAMDHDVAAEVKRRVVPVLCRLALEAAAYGVVQRRELTAGRSHHAIEASWTAEHLLRSRLALALHGDAAKSIDNWLNTNPRHKDAFLLCNRSVHQGSDHTDHAESVRAVRTAVDNLRAAT